MMLLLVALPVMFLAAFYGYRKLTLSYDYCGSYGRVDNEAGWVLKPNVSSCLSLKNHLTGEIFFDTNIYTNQLGFRDIEPNRVVPQNAIAMIGDSWTFGYGVNYESSFPYLVSKELNTPTLNMGVPAYGSGSTFQLFSRHVNTIKPKVVVYFSLGLWTRSICRASMVEQTLLPCYFIDQQNQAQFALPRAGLVELSASRSLYPGGYLTSGYNFRDIFSTKPREILQNLKQYVSAFVFKLSGVAVFQEELDSSPKSEDVAKILAFELEQYKNSLMQTDTTFILYDPYGNYAALLTSIQEALGDRFIYLGAERWRDEVAGKFIDMPAIQVKVPKDGHFAEGANLLIAKSIANALTQNGVILRR